jgi:hypothetical protein
VTATRAVTAGTETPEPHKRTPTPSDSAMGAQVAGVLNRRCRDLIEPLCLSEASDSQP